MRVCTERDLMLYLRTGQIHALCHRVRASASKQTALISNPTREFPRRHPRPVTKHGAISRNLESPRTKGPGHSYFGIDEKAPDGAARYESSNFG